MFSTTPAAPLRALEQGRKGLRVLGSELSPLHEPGDTMAAKGMAGSAQLLVDSGGAVEAKVLQEHRLDLSGDQGILGRPLSRRLLPLSTGVEPATGHPQIPA